MMQRAHTLLALILLPLLLRCAVVSETSDNVSDEEEASKQQRAELSPASLGDGEPSEPSPCPEKSKTGARSIRIIHDIEKTLKTTRYQHATKVDVVRGSYFWDCSGMATWVLSKAGHRSVKLFGKKRAVARDFYRAIERAPTKARKAGWQRIADPRKALPGDVIAWERPSDLKGDFTGHVGFIVSPLAPVAILDDTYTAKITDSTELPYLNDSRSIGGAGGFGTGTITLFSEGDLLYSGLPGLKIPGPVVIGRLWP